MRIAALTAWHVRIPLRKAIRHASHTRSDTDNLIVRCTLADGTIGFGEGVPRSYVTGETIDTALALLKTSDLKSQVDDCPDFVQAVRWAENLRLAPVPGDDRQCQGNAARCAVELAVLDAFGRHFHEPLRNVVKIVAADLFKPRDWVRYSGAITSAQGRKIRFLSWMLWIYGFRQLKVKVGIAGQDDVDRIRAVRRRVGKKVDLRIDANESWSPADAVSRIAQFEPFGVSSVEQPLPHADVARLADIRRQVKPAIMLDESLCGMVDAERAWEGQWCDLFNLRLSKCGGFIPSLRLAQYARAKGLGYQLGCQIGESAILSAAGRHFATAVRDIRFLEGSYDRHLVREALGTRNITFGWGGWAPALTGVGGLGIDIDAAALERVAVRQEELLE